jgi:PAS domain S-box-containing protein
MTPLTSSRFWQRRVYEVAFLLSLVIVTLWIVPQVTTVAQIGVFSVPLLVAIGAAATSIGSVIFYFIKKSNYMPSLVIFTLFSFTIGLLIWETNGLASPYIGLWALIAFCSGIFGSWGVALVFVATTAYIVTEYAGGSFTVDQLTFAIIVSILPAIISLIVWRHQETVDESSKHVKHLTNQLSEVANRSEIVINAIGDGVIAIDSLGVIQLINPAAQQILGWGKQDALALNYKSVLQMLDADNHEPDPSQDPIDQVLNTNQLARTSAITIQTRSNKKITASLVVSPIGDAGSGVIAVFRDVTKEKAEEHEQAEFISTASHEMRTPVASIEGYLGLALNPNTAQIDDKARDFILKAHEAAQHLGRLFQDLLDVSKSEDGRMANVPKVVNLPTFTETIVEGLRTKATEKGLTLTYAPTGLRAQRTLVPAYYVNQDNDHIREIINNLVENAIKYTPQGEVVVDVDGSDDRVIVSVKDSGLGIPAEDVPHLFQKFYRVDNADRQAIGGTGLGLYLSRRLAEAMQGRIWVESTHGQGSTFYLELPRISTEEAQRLSEQQATAAAQPTITPASAASFPAPIAATPQTLAQPAQPSSPTPTQAPVNTPPQAQPTATVAPATTVPRGESLTREQIAERVRQLESLARKTNAERQAVPLPSRES